MSKLEKGIYNALLERGSILSGWKVKVTNVQEKCAGNDWVNVSVYITRARCRKPFMVWELAVYLPRDQINFEKSSFVYL